MSKFKQNVLIIVYVSAALHGNSKSLVRYLLLGHFQRDLIRKPRLVQSSASHLSMPDSLLDFARRKAAFENLLDGPPQNVIHFVLDLNI